MNSRDSELIRSLIKASLLNSFSEMNAQKATASFESRKIPREHLEHHPSIQTAITDKDMLLLHIDMALDAGDLELFMHLTNELKGMEVLV